MYCLPVSAHMVSLISPLLHVAMNKLTHQLLKIKARLGIAYRVSRLEKIATPSRRQGQEFFTDDSPRLDGCNGVRIELDVIVDRQFHNRTILVERNPPDPADFDPGDLDCRTRLES